MSKSFVKSWFSVPSNFRNTLISEIKKSYQKKHPNKSITVNINLTMDNTVLDVLIDDTPESHIECKIPHIASHTCSNQF